MDVDRLQDWVDLLPREGALGLVDVPHHHLAWLSMNVMVKALPRPSKAVCSGPRPICGSATITSRSLILSSNRSSSLRTSTTLTVGDNFPLTTTWMPSGAVLTACGELGIGM